ncbi:hypothetical protein OG943_16065 [Amycolatopsis sp. NBC_00345]|uniref:hypothetical protein n=1 Tax=Amycolatopsis sp. NBC_00345 TaxID=2975955 RepID=UPI002E260695
MNRLLDVLPAFENDPRIQLVVTAIDADPFQDGLAKALIGTGLITIPWEQAKNTPFDLAISASNHGDLADIPARRVILSHGIGYTKYPPTRDQGPGTRDQGPGTRDQGPGTRDQGPFGLSPEWLLSGGVPIADAFVLSHTDQLRLLEETVPAAAPTGVVAGDPCLDRIQASLPLRQRYRAALGIGDRALVLLTSTWSRRSLLGARPNLPRELLSELSPDSHVVALVLHPNITHGQGAASVRQWYADCLRSGMLILDEVDGWRAGLVAADVVIGDVGSVSGYGAAIGRPTLIGAFDKVPPNTAIAALGAIAPRLPLHGPYMPAIATASATSASELFAPVTELATSAPGESLSLLRTCFYELMDLTEPKHEVAIAPVSSIDIATRYDGAGAHFVHHEVDVERRLVRLSRRPAEVQRSGRDDDTDLHLSSSVDYPIRSLRTGSAVLTCRPEDPGTDREGWHQNVFARHPRCSVSAVPAGETVIAQLRSGPTLTLTAPAVPPEVLASIPHAWRAAGLDPLELAPGVLLVLSGNEHQVAVTAGPR